MAHPETDSDLHDHSATGRPRPDDTPPRNRVIMTYTVLAVITLVGLSFVFDSYIDVSRRGVRREHLAESQAGLVLEAYREEQYERLARGPMPIERAMEELVRRDRRALPLIRPTASDDQGPLQGWTQLPRAYPEPPTTTPVPEEGAVPPPTGPLPQGDRPEDVTLEGATGAVAP
nr:hypothetical protein [Myxococcota bacterium]